jgi:hypothetical protein
MLLNEDRNKETFQSYKHPSLDVGFCFVSNQYVPTSSVSARLYLPDIRVRSRIAVVFEADDLNALNADGDPVNLQSIGNTIIAFECIKARTKIARVSEILGKQGIPLTFPKSNIDGIAFETEVNAPYIDVVLVLGNPQILGRWSIYYEATSVNKLKRDEWLAYISTVNAEIMGAAAQLPFQGTG